MGASKSSRDFVLPWLSGRNTGIVPEIERISPNERAQVDSQAFNPSGICMAVTDEDVALNRNHRSAVDSAKRSRPTAAYQSISVHTPQAHNPTFPQPGRGTGDLSQQTTRKNHRSPRRQQPHIHGIC